MNSNRTTGRTTGRTRKHLPSLLLALCCVAAAYAPAASAQTYGLRSSDWTGSYSADPTSWFDCRNWDNSAPDRYTAVTVGGAATVTDNGSHKARAATLTIDTANGRLTIEAGGELEITAESSTPASTRRYDERTWLTSHNAHTALRYNVLYAQQTSSLRSQLDDGVRALMLDVHDWGGVDDDDLYLCHGADPSFCAIPFLNPNTLAEGAAAGVVAAVIAQLASCAASAGVTCGTAVATLGGYVLADEIARMKLAHGLTEVRQFLEANPSEIVTLIIEDYAESADINQRLVSAGLAGYMYDPAIDGPDGTTGCWPSTEWMVANGKRLVVFIQDGEADLDGRLLGQFAYTVENTYDIGVGESNYDATCAQRGSTSLTDRSRKLFVMNHFAEIALPTEFTIFSDFDSPFDGIDFSGSGSPNAYTRVLNRVDEECLAASERYPNFLAVDFYEYPSSGPDDVVATLNGRWTPDGFGYNVPAPSVPAGRGGASLAAETSGEGEASPESTAAPEGAKSVGEAVPEAYGLEPNYPNPFSSRTTIRYALPEASDVRLVVYDVLGREVAVLADGPFEASRHAVVFDGRGLPTGTYLVRMTTDGGFAQTQRVTLMR